MLAMFLFSALAASLVMLAGWRDKARDPRLTGVLLALTAAFPLLLAIVPKAPVIPAEYGTVAPALSSAGKVLLGFWLACSMVAALRLASSALSIWRWRRRSSLLFRVQNVEIRLLPGLRGPVAAGVIRPTVFVPVAWKTWSDETREMVLAHEISHHRRRDPLWRWIAEIACAVNGYNPLIIWMGRRLAMQCEFACDSMVVGRGTSLKNYARLLCDFADEGRSRSLAMAISNPSTLEMRVKRLMGPAPRLGAAAVGTLVAVAVGLAVASASLAIDNKKHEVISTKEVELRWNANPFPGN